MFLITFTLVASANAQKLDASKVPAAVKESFGKQYPTAKPSWKKEGSNYEAEFKNNGTEMSAVYDASGKMMESETDIKISELPPTVMPYVNEHYKGKKITEASKITMSNGTIEYEAEVEGKDLMFDANGKFIKVSGKQ